VVFEKDVEPFQFHFCDPFTLQIIQTFKVQHTDSIIKVETANLYDNMIILTSKNQVCLIELDYELRDEFSSRFTNISTIISKLRKSCIQGLEVEKGLFKKDVNLAKSFKEQRGKVSSLTRE